MAGRRIKVARLHQAFILIEDVRVVLGNGKRAFNKPSPQPELQHDTSLSALTVGIE
jgi:hypothetical protein